jgi:hypothetical protein
MPDILWQDVTEFWAQNPSARPDTRLMVEKMRKINAVEDQKQAMIKPTEKGKQKACEVAPSDAGVLDSDDCQLAAIPPAVESESDDDDYYDGESPSYSSSHRVSLRAQGVDPTPPPSPPVYASPYKHILTPQCPTACITSRVSEEDQRATSK